MTTGILYVLHGRRGKVSRANLGLLAQLKQVYSNPQDLGFLEGDVQTLEDRFTELQAQVDHMIVAPILLFPATHVRWDIPRRVEKLAKPGLQLTYLQPLATTQAIYQFLKQQIAAALAKQPQRSVLLVAHGTPHFAELGAQLQALAKRLHQDLNVPVLWAQCKGRPLLAQVLADQTQPLIVQRVFLTEGRIAGIIRNTVAAKLPDSAFLPTLEDQPALQQAVEERINAVL